MSGTLTISGGISRFEGTRLMKGAVNNGGFGRATNFLEVDRGLKNNDEIFVIGTDDTFGQMPIIVITDAGKAGAEAVARAAGKTRRSIQKARSRKAGKKKSAGPGKKSARKVSKSTKSTKKSARKATVSKKSAKKRARAK